MVLNIQGSDVQSSLAARPTPPVALVPVRRWNVDSRSVSRWPMHAKARTVDPAGGPIRYFRERRRDVPIRLFCFPWSGAGASAFRPLASSMPDYIEPLGIQLPGRGDRRGEPTCRSLQPLARDITGAVHRELSDRPGRFAFYGHSFGALMAYEVACGLSNAGWHPELAVFSGSRAPNRPPRVVLHTGSDARLLSELKRMGGLKSARMHDIEFLNYFLPLVRADLTTVETYRPAFTSRLHCPVSVWAGSEDWYAPPEDTAWWHDLAGSTYRSRMFGGGHFFINDVDAVTAALLSDLR
jgi:medium-chain acyl-[acyl-carrier-protein] hydrolase